MIIRRCDICKTETPQEKLPRPVGWAVIRITERVPGKVRDTTETFTYEACSFCLKSIKDMIQ